MDVTHFIQTVMTGRGRPNPFPVGTGHKWINEKNILGFPSEESDKWLRERISYFKKYTIPSLQNQTNKNFIHWISFAEGTRFCGEVLKLHDYLKSIDYPFIFTFQGQPYWDDKDRYSNEKIPVGTNPTLKRRLEASLSVIEKYTKGKEYVYFTVLDSDDMLHRDFIENVQKIPFKERRVVVCGKGYALAHLSERYPKAEVADWIPTTNPPFYTIMYPTDVFTDAEKKLKYDEPFRSHEDIPRVFEPIKLPDYSYCYLFHMANKGTSWEHPFRGQVYPEEQWKKIIKGYGQ